MRISTQSLAFIALAGLVAPAILLGTSHASDHADTPDIAHNPGVDITDVHIFPSPSDKTKVVLAMSVHPVIAPGDGLKTPFDPNVLYQFKVDSTGDGIEDVVIQARFTGSTADAQRIMISKPVVPSTKGVLNNQEPMLPTTAHLNEAFSPAPGMRVFAGGREDAFFFDLEQFFNIFPDRATPFTGVPVDNPNTPRTTTWRDPAHAVDFLSNGGFNVLSIVVELPRKQLLNRGGGPISRTGVIGVWCTTSVPNGNAWRQMDRLARPAINELFATVANDEHKKNDEIGPAQDKEFLKPEIYNFMTTVAGRSPAIANVVTAVTIPDVLTVNLASGDAASYLGYETNGATGGRFGGRGLSDDVIDISLGIVFGGTIPALGLAPEDGKEIPSLTSDNVGPGGKHFLPSFPFLGEPR